MTTKKSTPKKKSVRRTTDESALDGAACSASCFVAGIVKGLIESEDPYLHFGSLMAFGTHVREALKCRVVEGDVKNLCVTEYGRTAYLAWDIAKEKGRAYMWRQKSFILPNVKGDSQSPEKTL